MPLINRQRGEVSAILAGTPRRLCLTLGALAQIETVLDLDDWSQLPQRMARLSARDLVAVLAALLRGGGESEAADALGETAVDVREAAAAVAAALAAAA